MKLSTHKQNWSVKGLGPAIEIHEATGATVQSRHTAFSTKLQFLVREQIIERLPLTTVTIEHLQIPSQLPLADSRFHVPDKVDALVGASVFWDLLCIGQIKLGRNQPILQKTHLGWIAAGDVMPHSKQTALSCVASDASLHEQVEKFWNLEEVEQRSPQSAGNDECDIDFVRTYQRGKDGRFTVKLPFRRDPGELGESRDNALRRFHRLERKLEQQPEIRQQYIQFMKEYLELGYMSLLTGIEGEASKAHYIPHHAVVTRSNDRLKLRVVFDASAKTKTGIALNDILRAEPTIQPTLFATVLRF